MDGCLLSVLYSLWGFYESGEVFLFENYGKPQEV